MNLNEPRFQKAAVLKATPGLTSDKFHMWLTRGAVQATVDNPGPGQPKKFSALDIARIAAVNGLVQHGVSVSAAADIVSAAIENQTDDWAALVANVAAGERRYLWILVSPRERGHIETLLYTGEDIAVQVDLMNHRDASGWTGEARDMGEDDYYRTAVYNIGPDVRRAMRALEAEP